MDTTTLKKIKQLHWEFYWSGNWPMLDSVLETGPEYIKTHKHIAGITRTTRVDISQNRISTVYHAEEEYERLDKYFLNKFQKNPYFILQSAKPYKKKVTADIAELKKINSIKNLNLLSNGQLIKLFTKARSHFAYNAAVDHYDWYMERLFIPVLEQLIADRLNQLKKPELVSEYINTLLTPHEVSEIFKERRMFFNIIKFIRKNPSLMLALKQKIRPKSNKQLNSLITLYLSKYNWMPVLVNNPPTTLESLWKDIISYIRENKPLKVQSKRLGDDYNIQTIEKSKRYFKELKPNKKMVALIKGLRAMAFLRTEDYAVMSQSSYLVIPLYSEIARRLGLNYYDLKEFIPNEITKLLKANKKVTQTELKQRLKLSINILIQGKSFLLTGKNAEKIKKIISKARYGHKAQTEFHGTPAHNGIVTGKVKIALNPKMLKTIKKGDVVVGSFMSSMFAHGLSKASALVTEYGGLTSHPVIVAREFDIPCIVGIKNITKHLKDGDIVQVNANNGTVKRIK